MKNVMLMMITLGLMSCEQQPDRYVTGVAISRMVDGSKVKLSVDTNFDGNADILTELNENSASHLFRKNDTVSVELWGSLAFTNPLLGSVLSDSTQ